MMCFVVFPHGRKCRLKYRIVPYRKTKQNDAPSRSRSVENSQPRENQPITTSSSADATIFDSAHLGNYHWHNVGSFFIATPKQATKAMSSTSSVVSEADTAALSAPVETASISHDGDDLGLVLTPEDFAEAGRVIAAGNTVAGLLPPGTATGVEVEVGGGDGETGNTVPLSPSSPGAFGNFSLFPFQQHGETIEATDKHEATQLRLTRTHNNAIRDICDAAHVQPREAAPLGSIDGGCLTAGKIAPASPLLPGGAATVGEDVNNRHGVNGAVNFPATMVRTIIISGCTQTENRSTFGCLRRQRVDLSPIVLLVICQK